MRLWSDGVALTPPDTMHKGYTLTGTVSIRWTQTWQKGEVVGSIVRPM